jgi:hypothetical protein
VFRTQLSKKVQFKKARNKQLNINKEAALKTRLTISRKFLKDFLSGGRIKMMTQL